MNAQFTHDEINLMCIYNPGSRKALIQELTHMKAFLERDEADLLALTESTIKKLSRITDSSSLDLRRLCTSQEGTVIKFLRKSF